MQNVFFQISDEVQVALDAKRPLVALESTLITHGLPWPQNKEIALALQAVIREEGALPATIGVLEGCLIVGLSEAQIVTLAQTDSAQKASRRDLATLCALKQSGATTVAATMLLAAKAGLRIFATGGIGGVHRGAEQTFDISADLMELAKTPVAVVCAGAKSILDLPKTLEVLETQSVPVVGFGTSEFPAFYTRKSGLKLEASVATAKEAALLLKMRDGLKLGGGEVIANPIPQDQEIPRPLVEGWLAQAMEKATAEGVRGKEMTPFLLAQLAVLSAGKSIQANRALLLHNARVAARIARAYVEESQESVSLGTQAK